ncbi:MAG: pyruvate dehydrogenase (acetyl-transferring) E1 component subunit alpha, partial [Chloroflexi bacterium]|nr:pyruvate dehydrogenase (acetyl-transferring) E1 component subunit alpha [Chloroflexota bacterium]
MIVIEENRDAISTYGREELLRLHYQMVLIRRFEERVGEMYLRAKIGGYCHLNLGEEAAVVGSLAGVADQDYILTSYREHGHAITRGISPGAVMAELFGKVTGCARGRGGSMHLYDAERRFLGGYAIVGAHMPLATGIGLAINMRRSNEAVICYIGDGATNIGAFHESMNIAKLWRLPVVFFLINNQYGMGTPVAKASSVPELWRKAQGYDVIAERIDGTDVLAVRRATEHAMRRARELKEPTLIEAVCYRYRGWLMQQGLTNDEDLPSQEERAIREVDEAVAFADASPNPDASELFT